MRHTFVTVNVVRYWDGDDRTQEVELKRYAATVVVSPELEADPPALRWTLYSLSRALERGLGFRPHDPRLDRTTSTLTWEVRPRWWDLPRWLRLRPRRTRTTTLARYTLTAVGALVPGLGAVERSLR